MLTTEPPYEQIIFPFGNSIAGIKYHPAGGKHRIPVIYRLLHTGFLLYCFPDFIATIFETVGNNWPAIIFSRLYNINLITTTGTKFSLP